MLCPKCGAYSPYNTAVCNRCGTKLLGKKAGESPKHSQSGKYYKRIRQSGWEQNRDQFFARVNDSLDGIMADKSKRVMLIAAAAAVAAVLIASMVGCISCTCRGCGSCASGTDAPVSGTVVSDGDSAGTVSSSDPGKDTGFGNLFNAFGSSDSQTVSGTDETSSADAVSSSDLTSGSDGEVSDEQLVMIKEYIPTVHIDLRYATENNFTGEIIYDFTQPRLRYGTVKKLIAAQNELQAMGYSLTIWDGYRPTSAQFRLWEICPDPQYVSDPSKGFSGHSRGNTVDVTIVDSDGKTVAMPTDYDDFTALADRDYSDVPEQEAKNAAMLEKIMTDCGFKGYDGEWWHYTDTVEYPVVEE